VRAGGQPNSTSSALGASESGSDSDRGEAPWDEGARSSNDDDCKDRAAGKQGESMQGSEREGLGASREARGQAPARGRDAACASCEGDGERSAGSSEEWEADPDCRAGYTKGRTQVGLGHRR
jgi:hypothetical protein